MEVVIRAHIDLVVMVKAKGRVRHAKLENIKLHQEPKLVVIVLVVGSADTGASFAAEAPPDCVTIVVHVKVVNTKVKRAPIRLRYNVPHVTHVQLDNIEPGVRERVRGSARHVRQEPSNH